MDFLAKSHPKETIEEHTQKLLDEFEKLKKLYPNINYLDWELLRLACLYHDLGKTNSKFQNKIKANIEGIKREKDDTEIPHGYLSPAFIPLENLTNEYNKDDIKVLMQSIYYHHIREQKDYIHIKKEIEEDLSNIYKDIDFLGLNIEKLNTKYSKYIRGRIEEDEDYNKKELVNIKKKYIMTKGLLNKIDYAASSDVEVEKENKDLFRCTMDFFNKGNFKPNELQKYMMENNDENIIAVASTGIGKTEAALLWIGNNKGFFTLPLRVSINAIYDRLIDREKINFPKEYTGLLHSNTASEYIKRDDEKELDKNYLDSTKQLSMPITVCTLDQLIDFVFKYEGYELKLATLSYSKLVIDEIQMYSPEMLAYLIVALKNIVEFGGKFAILTATLPPIVENLLLYPLLDNGKRITYKKSNKAFLKLDENGKSIIRHRIKVKDEAININDILENGNDKKVLVIVNTVNEAQRIYSELKNKLDNVNIFHARYINKDKKELEDKILSIGSIKNKEKGIWITTQVVEASLDIDFDVLYTELSELSGLFQRMGRVYRNRILKNNDFNVYVYTGGETGYPTGVSLSDKGFIDIDIFNLAKKVILDFGEGILSEEDKMKMIEDTYTYENLSESEYYKKVKMKIEEMLSIIPYTYKKKDVDLREIDSNTVIPNAIYNKYYDDIESLKQNIKNSTIKSEIIKYKDEIMKYTLSIPAYRFETAKKEDKIIDTLEVDKFTYIPVVDYEYDEMGLKFNFNEDVDLQFI